MNAALVEKFFAAADSRQPQSFVRLLTTDVAWTFGNMPTVHGREAVASLLGGFFEHVAEMSHRIVGVWTAAECVTAETRVRYVDRFGRRFEFPGCDVLFYDGELVREVRIFVDNHELFVPPSATDGTRGSTVPA